MDSKHKTQIWKKIGEELRQPAINCKSRWQNMRDQFRKSWAKRATKPTKNRRYKYEENMAFLPPYFIERDKDTSTSQVELDCDILFDESTDPNDLEDTLNVSRKRKLSQQEATSTTLMKYTTVKEEDPLIADAEPHPIDAFLSGLAATIKSFSPYYQHLAKGKLFAVVQEMELQQLREANQEAESRSSTPTWKTSP